MAENSQVKTKMLHRRYPKAPLGIEIIPLEVIALKMMKMNTVNLHTFLTNRERHTNEKCNCENCVIFSASLRPFR